MKVYSYTEARQNLAEVLDTAEATGKVLIRRRGGSVFALIPERASKSPLDVPSIKVDYLHTRTRFSCEQGEAPN
ncbi:MAG: type II toxin-antitoxin system Phd/YefM family antitoxin [Candidatus Sumerlaeota bacterium]|nr:type II toxin-antitoxin system Phd/YefM family antitoxin [Candidatus Sumerlaeota bacterium]